MSVFKADELNEIYEGMTCKSVAECVLTRPLVGGLPADDAGIRAFCTHHLKLDGDELDNAVDRIKTQEVGESNVTPENGEVSEVESYGVNVQRHCVGDGCCWLGDFQIKACLKQAASRIGFFKKKIGSKGDMAEMGRVRAAGISLGGEPEEIRLIGPDGKPYRGGLFEKFMGRVNTPQGAKSIVHDSEIAPPGCRFTFELRVAKGRFTKDIIAQMFAAAQQLGLGSARSMERGKFKVEKLEIMDVK